MASQFTPRAVLLQRTARPNLGPFPQVTTVPGITLAENDYGTYGAGRLLSPLRRRFLNTRSITIRRLKTLAILIPTATLDMRDNRDCFRFSVACPRTSISASATSAIRLQCR